MKTFSALLAIQKEMVWHGKGRHFAGLNLNVVMRVFSSVYSGRMVLQTFRYGEKIRNVLLHLHFIWPNLVHFSILIIWYKKLHTKKSSIYE